MNYQDYKDAKERIKIAREAYRKDNEQKLKPSYNMWQNSAYMLKYVKRTYPSLLVWSIAGAIAAVLLAIANTYLPKTVLAAVEQNISLWTLVGIIVVYTLVLAVLAAIPHLVYPHTEIKQEYIAENFQYMLSAKKLTTDYENLYKSEFNLLSHHANRSYWACHEIYTILVEILTKTLLFIFFTMLLSRVNILLLIVVIVTSVISYFFNRKMESLNNECMAEYKGPAAKLWYLQHTSTDTNCAKDIRIFGMQGWFSDMYRAFLDMCLAVRIDHEIRRFFRDLVALICTLLRNGLAYVYLLALVFDNQITVSDFVLYFGAVGTFTQYIGELLKSLGNLHRFSLEFCYVRDCLDYKDHFPRTEGKPLAALDIPYEIKVVDLHYRYPDATEDTLKGINLTIRPGEKLAVIGLNGAGKTTLVRVICGLLDPTEGQVLLNGVDIREYNRLDYYKLFTALFQDLSVLPNTVAENIAQQELSEIDMYKVKQCAQLADIDEKIVSLPDGYETHLTRKVHGDGVELSGGQIQRLMLARAIYKNAPLMVLDEPTAALDPIAESTLYQKYSQLVNGKLSLFISHRLASTQFCDRIIMMDSGLIVEEGTHAELISKGGKYAELFEIQSHYYKEGVVENGE